MAEQSNNPVDALIGLIRAQLMDVNTCIPGVIVSYKDGLAEVLPTGKKRFANGNVLDYPIIPTVRVCWPSFAGGAAGIKGPVTAGDKCLLVFSQQAVDGSDDRRMFDLQDAYAVMVDLGSTGAGDSANNDDVTVYFAKSSIKITKGGDIKVTSTGLIEINASGDVNIAATGKTTIKGSTIDLGAAVNAMVVEAFLTAFDTHTHTTITLGSPTTPPLIPQALVATNKTSKTKAE